MFGEWSQSKVFKALIFLVLVCGIMALVSYARYAYKQSNALSYETISVEGKAETFVKPDIATFTYMVSAEEKDAPAAQAKSAEKGNAIKAYLKEMGVEDKDVQTSYYNMYPKYEWENPAPMTEMAYQQPQNQVITGYVAEETVTVKVRALEEAGDLLSGVGTKGAMNVSGISFAVDNTDAAKEELKAKAIEDAKGKAKKLAENLGVHLGKIQSFYDNQPDPYYYGGYESASMAKSDTMMGAQSPELSAGENKITSSVTLTYKIQ